MNVISMRYYIVIEYVFLDVVVCDCELFYKYMGYLEMINENIYQCFFVVREIIYVGKVFG